MSGVMPMEVMPVGGNVLDPHIHIRQPVLMCVCTDEDNYSNVTSLSTSQMHYTQVELNKHFPYKLLNAYGRLISESV